jgi:protein-serine/threonine kinase
MTDTTASTDAAPADDGPEGSDKPPHRDTNKYTKSSQRRSSNGMQLASANVAPSAMPVQPPTPTTSPGHVPLPPPDSHSYPKKPGPTRRDLQQLEQLEKLNLNGGVPQMMNKKASSSTTGSITPSTSESPSASESESWSLPSTQPPSRAPSFSRTRAGGKASPDNSERQPLERSPSRTSVKSKASSKTPTVERKISPTPSRESTKEGRPKGPPSVHSDSGQKFTLKDLLGAPKLVRRSSARSTGSSKKSGGSDGGRSVAGDSTASLLKKYGVCEKVAIGKGATSVVRLAHKWDRSEEKLYAVKVHPSMND